MCSCTDLRCIAFDVGGSWHISRIQKIPLPSIPPNAYHRGAELSHLKILPHAQAHCMACPFVPPHNIDSHDDQMRA